MPTLIIPDKERKTERRGTVADMAFLVADGVVMMKGIHVRQLRLVANGLAVVLPEERVREIMESFPKAEGNGDTDHPSISITITTKEHRLLLPLG